MEQQVTLVTSPEPQTLAAATAGYRCMNHEY
jgi:hypothetical protein